MPRDSEEITPSSSERYEEIQVRIFPTSPFERKHTRKGEEKYQQKKTGKMAKRETEKFVENELPQRTFAGADCGSVESILQKNLSLLCGYLKLHESIYEYIYRGEGRIGGWYKHLVTKTEAETTKILSKPRKRRFRENTHLRRPAIITKRTRFGDWETDSVIFSKQKSVLSVQYERKMKLCRLESSEQNSDRKRTSYTGHFSRLPRQLRRSITRDNGTENVLHRNETSTSYRISFYLLCPKENLKAIAFYKINQSFVRLHRNSFEHHYNLDIISCTFDTPKSRFKTYESSLCNDPPLPTKRFSITNAFSPITHRNHVNIPYLHPINLSQT